MTNEQRQFYEKVLAEDHFLGDGKCEDAANCYGVTHHTVTREEYMRAVELSI
jgi:hypothetical protein